MHACGRPFNFATNAAVKVMALPALTIEQKEHFEEYGFVHVPDVFDPESIIDPVIDEYAGVLDALAKKLHSEGKISSTSSE